MREKYLKNIGALDHIRVDFEYESGYHREKREEEKHPYRKGERDWHIRNMALLKRMSGEELAEQMAGAFKKKNQLQSHSLNKIFHNHNIWYLGRFNAESSSYHTSIFVRNRLFFAHTLSLVIRMSKFILNFLINRDQRLLILKSDCGS